MSGRRQKLLRKQKDTEYATTRNIELKRLESLAAIPAGNVPWYLSTKFTGKTGYHYISVSKYGSLFADPSYEGLVPVLLHHKFPVTLSMGRFQSPDEKDCAIGLVRVPREFSEGVIISREGELFVGGKHEAVPKSAWLTVLCDLGRASASEYRAAIQSQQEYFNQKMEAVMAELNRQTDLLMKTPYDDDDPYDAEPASSLPTKEEQL